jgi:hypothetical protein
MLHADLQIEYRGNSTPPERNMIAQRGVGISRGRLFKCRRLTSALCVPRLDEKGTTPYFYRLLLDRLGGVDTYRIHQHSTRWRWA